MHAKFADVLIGPTKIWTFSCKIFVQFVHSLIRDMVQSWKSVPTNYCAYTMNHVRKKVLFVCLKEPANFCLTQIRQLCNSLLLMLMYMYKVAIYFFFLSQPFLWLIELCEVGCSPTYHESKKEQIKEKEKIKTKHINKGNSSLRFSVFLHQWKKCLIKYS